MGYWAHLVEQYHQHHFDSVDLGGSTLDGSKVKVPEWAKSAYEECSADDDQPGDMAELAAEQALAAVTQIKPGLGPGLVSEFAACQEVPVWDHGAQCDAHDPQTSSQPIHYAGGQTAVPDFTFDSPDMLPGSR